MAPCPASLVGGLHYFRKVATPKRVAHSTAGSGLDCCAPVAPVHQDSRVARSFQTWLVFRLLEQVGTSNTATLFFRAVAEPAWSAGMLLKLEEAV